MLMGDQLDTACLMVMTVNRHVRMITGKSDGDRGIRIYLQGSSTGPLVNLCSIFISIGDIPWRTRKTVPGRDS